MWGFASDHEKLNLGRRSPEASTGFVVDIIFLKVVSRSCLEGRSSGARQSKHAPRLSEHLSLTSFGRVVNTDGKQAHKRHTIFLSHQHLWFIEK